MKIKWDLSAACDGSPRYRISGRYVEAVYGTSAQIFEKYFGIHLKILGYNGWHEADSLLKTHT